MAFKIAATASDHSGSHPGRMVTNWEREEPPDSRVLLPAVAFAAGLAVCMSWGWWQMLAALIVGWLSLARPTELLALRHKDLILSSELGLSCAASPAFIVFRHPEGSWVGTRRGWNMSTSAIRRGSRF